MGKRKYCESQQSLPFDQAIEKWNSTILTIKKHIYRKRKQVASYNQQKLDLKPVGILIYVDYSKSCSNSQQYEVQSACFGQQNSLAFLTLALITATVTRSIWLKFQWRLLANQMITLESLH